MLATAAGEPFDSADYLFEVKWDGIRCMCAIQDGNTRLYSRTGRDITRLFPELQRLPDALAARAAVLDGELCVLQGATPSFHHIQRRNVLSANAAIQQAVRDNPALYFVFDMLHIDGTNLTGLPLSERRRRLEHAWRGSDNATLSVAVRERGRDLYAASIAQGLEGIVAKRLDSPYVPGRRTRHWLKIRQQRELDSVIGGYTPRGANDFASLAIGLYEDSLALSRADRPDDGPIPVPALTYIGNVGTGFSARLRHEMMERLDLLTSTRSPFVRNASAEHARAADPRIPSDTQWVEPRLVCRVGYLHFTPGGHLRHPTFLGLREDKHPHECTMLSVEPQYPPSSKAARPEGR